MSGFSAKTSVTVRYDGTTSAGRFEMCSATPMTGAMFGCGLRARQQSRSRVRRCEKVISSR